MAKSTLTARFPVALDNNLQMQTNKYGSNFLVLSTVCKDICPNKALI